MFDSRRTTSLENLLPWVALDGEGLLTNFFAFPSSVLLLTFTIKLALTFLCHLAFFVGGFLRDWGKKDSG